MNSRKIDDFWSRLYSLAGIAAASSAALRRSQTFKNYRCADGTQFMVGFFQYDSRAHLQLDGKAVTLAKRLALSGSRYSGGGVTLKITRAGAPRSSMPNGRSTACEQT